MHKSFFALLLLSAAFCSAESLETHAASAVQEPPGARCASLRLLCIAAHPDDEDGATLAYYRFQHGVDTHVAIATRGEGGQNEIGPELYGELAAIRTGEMKAAARIEGAHLHILDLPDFGFSKSLEETQDIWGRDETLLRVVRLIREVRPQVIITHHGRMKDHGHHQAIGAATIEAFDKAADPGYDPPDAADDACARQRHLPWQTSRLYIRDFAEAGDVTVPIHEQNETVHKSYAELAADALRAHRSQGMEFFIERLLSGNATVNYDLVKGEAPKDMADSGCGDLFAGLDGSAAAAPRDCPPLFDPDRREFPAEDSPLEHVEVIAVPGLERPEVRAIGLIKAYDVTLEQTLARLGLPFELIEENAFGEAALDQFGTIIVDMRAYQYRNDLVANNATLLDWCERGGTLIVMYQKTFEWREEFAPYPLRISRNRVTREDAPVKHRVPEHAFFHTPNPITAGDWEGWIQERGLYYADQWDEAYTPLLEMTDPGEQIPPGSMLIASHGEGTYVYSALVWYRQLRELHPGALRLFCNLLAL